MTDGQKTQRILRKELHGALSKKPFNTCTVQVGKALHADGWSDSAIEVVITSIDTLVKPVVVKIGNKPIEITKVRPGFHNAFDDLIAPVLQIKSA